MAPVWRQLPKVRPVACREMSKANYDTPFYGRVPASTEAADEDDLAKLAPCAEGLAGWAIWPMNEFVAMRGLAAPERALRTLHALTQRSTAEFAIRAFLIEHEVLTLRTLRGWLDDPSPHVRRLISEGTRPRLPWGVRLPRFIADPTPTLPLLTALQDDPSGPFIGAATLSQIYRGPFSACYLGYHLDFGFVGQGLMQEALSAVVRHAFESLRLHRIMANYVPTNRRSASVLSRLGFVIEGYAREYVFIDGAWRDHVLTSLTNREVTSP